MLFEDLQAYAEGLLVEHAKIDYFATSLPLLLVFEDDLDLLQHEEASRLIALAEQGLQRVSCFHAGSKQQDSPFSERAGIPLRQPEEVDCQS